MDFLSGLDKFFRPIKNPLGRGFLSYQNQTSLEIFADAKIPVHAIIISVGISMT
jgi:hypothetical protein